MGDQEWQYQPAADSGLPPLERFRSVRREPGLISWTLHHGSALAISAYFRVAHRLAITGRAHVPIAPPFVIVANHASHFDALILATALPSRVRGSAYPVAAGDVFFESAATSVLTALFMNALPIWRKRVTRHALDDLRDRLCGGDCGLILFPEGARTRDGQLLPFKSGIGRLVAASEVPVVPCWIAGAFNALPPDCRRPRLAKISVSIGEPLRFRAIPNEREGWDEITSRIQQAVVALAPTKPRQ